MKVFIDLGAYAGDATAYTLGLWGSEVRVHAFEPCPWFLPRLRDRFGSNANVVIHDVAAWSTDGKATLYVRDGLDATTLFGDITAGARTVEKIAVRTINFSDWIEANIDAGDEAYLKMNIEGSEYAILESLCGSGMIRRIAWMSFLPHANIIPSLAPVEARCSKLLADLGYGKEKSLDWTLRDMWKLRHPEEVVVPVKPVEKVAPVAPVVEIIPVITEAPEPSVQAIEEVTEPPALEGEA